MTKKADYIIVGQGLAGTCLAFQLMALGKEVLIIDEQKDNTSSKVAAGLYNPVTGRNLVLTWKAHELFDYMTNFYTGIEQKLSSKFLYPTTIYRPFASMEEQNEWMGKSADIKHEQFIENLHTKPAHDNHVKDPFGGLSLKNCGYLDIPEFLKASRNYFVKKDIVIDAPFNYEELVLNTEINYKSIEAEKIIFCTGMEAKKTNLFEWLPFSLVKGEILDMVPQEKFNVIYNKGVFIMPRNDDSYLVGATYEVVNIEEGITEKARNTLLEKLNAIFKINYKITGQRAGIRPATRDRKPFIGMHPEKPQIGIFNGLGAKGVTLAPFFAKQFAENLVNGLDLDKEVNVNRYNSLYFDSRS